MEIKEKWQTDKAQKYINNTIWGGEFVPINDPDFISVQEKIPPYDGFNDIPYFNYCYGSAFGYWSHLGGVTYSTDDSGNDILHVGMAVDSSTEAVKHYLSSTSTTSAGVDARMFLTDLSNHQNADNVWQDTRAPGYYVAANNFNPFTDLTYERIKIGVRFKVIDTTIPWGLTGYVIDVDDIDTLLSLDKDRYLVWYTETYNWVKNDSGGWYRGYNRQSSFTMCYINEHFIVQQSSRKSGNGYNFEGLNLVPQCMFDFLRDGNNALLYGENMPLRSSDTGFNVIGLYHSANSENLDLLCVPGSKQKLASGVTYYCCHDYGANSHRYVFRSMLDIEQTIKELAYLGLIICPLNDPDTYQHDYVGYVNNSGEATGELLKYEEFKNSDSLQNTYKSMVETPDIPVKPAETKNQKLTDIAYFTGSIPSFTKSYILTREQLHNISEFIETSETTDLINKIVSVEFYPFSIPYESQTQNIKIGSIDTGINAHLSYSAVKIYLGRFYVDYKFYDFRDFHPYTKWTLHTPFSPDIDLDVNKVIGHWIEVVLLLTPENGNGSIILYYNNGGLSVPFSITPVKSGVSIELTADSFAMRENAYIQSTMNFTNGLISAGTSIATKNPVSMVQGGLSLLNSTLDVVETLNKDFTHSSGFNGTASDLLHPLTCFVTVKRAKYHIQDNFAHETGYRCNESKKIGSFSGFTIFKNVDTTGLSCTDEEKQEIKRILETGIIL